jgi:hypothetical protein
MKRMPALVLVSSFLAACSGGAQMPAPAAPVAAPASPTPASTPAPVAAPVAEPAPAPVAEPAPEPAPAAMPARSATTTPTPELRDPERCKRPTRAYPRWCNDLEKSRVTEKKQ